MRRIPQTVSLLAVSVFTLGLVVAAPVSAREAESGGGNNSGRSTTSGSSSGSSTTTSTVKAEDHATAGDDGTADQGSGEVEAERVTTKPAELRERAKTLVAEKRASGKEKSLEVRQKSCEQRKADIVKRSGNYSANATKHLGKFNSIYDKVLTFKASKNLTAANFDALKATADQKKVAATDAVAAIANVTTDIDCASADPAATVAAVKEAVKNARTALQEYRLAIKDMVVALKSAADKTKPAAGTTETNDSGADSPSDTAGGTN